MVPKIVLLVALAAVAVNARRAPHADYVENLIKSSGARFSSDILEDSLLDAVSKIPQDFDFFQENFCGSNRFIMDFFVVRCLFSTDIFKGFKIYKNRIIKLTT